MSGAATGTGPIKISDAALPAKPTTGIAYAANLPSTPTTTSGNALLARCRAAIPGALGDRRDGADGGRRRFGRLPRFQHRGWRTHGLFRHRQPVSLQMRWAKVANADATAGTGDTWNLYYANQTATGTTPATWQNAGTAFTFNGSGQLTAPTGTSLSIPNVTVNGTNLGAVALNLGTGGLTQYGSAGGQVTTTTLQQNGYAAGTLNSLAVTSDGKLTGTYSNGNSVALAQVGVARFNAPIRSRRSRAATTPRRRNPASRWSGSPAPRSSAAMSSNRIPIPPASSRSSSSPSRPIRPTPG